MMTVFANWESPRAMICEKKPELATPSPSWKGRLISGRRVARKKLRKITENFRNQMMLLKLTVWSMLISTVESGTPSGRRIHPANLPSANKCDANLIQFALTLDAQTTCLCIGQFRAEVEYEVKWTDYIIIHTQGFPIVKSAGSLPPRK